MLLMNIFKITKLKITHPEILTRGIEILFWFNLRVDNCLIFKIPDNSTEF